VLDLAKCFSHSRDLGFITDSRGLILATTAGTERALGFSRVELVGQNLSHLDETGDLRRFFETLPVRSRMNLGFHLKTKPGAVLTVSALATSLRDEAGEPVGWFLAAQDLKGAVGESRGAQPILDALIDSIGAALWSFDRNGLVITWSRACETEFSLPREEAERKLSAERLFASPEEYRSVLETVDRSGRFSGEVSLRGPGGAPRPTHLSVTPLVSGGLPVGYSAVSIDVADRKRAEELKRTYFEQAGGAILVVDIETRRVVDANARTCEMHGFSREELIGLHVSALRPPGAPDSDEAIARALREEGRYVNDRELARRKDGSVFPCAVDLRRITVGGKSYSVTVVHDLTAQRRAEEFQRILFDRAGEAILVCDQVTLQVLDVNARACEMHGYPREELLRLRVSDFVAPQDYPRMEAIGATLAETGRYDGQQLLLRKDGSAFPCALNLRTVVLGDRRLTVSVYRDVTEQLKAQEFQRILFEQAGEAILVVEQPTRRVLDANARACEMHGYTRDEFLKLRIPDFLPPEALPKMEEVGGILRESGRFDGQLYHRRKDGSVFPCAVNLKMVVIGDRKLVVCVYRDLTEQLKAQEFFRVLFEKATDAVYLVADEGLRVVEANEAACRLLGYSRDEFLKLGVVDLVPPPYRHRIPEFHDSVRNGPGYRRDRRVLFRKDGQAVATDHAVSRVEISGKPYYMASCRDLTDQERAARELEEAKAFLEHVQENASDGLALLDENGIFVAVNQKLLEMNGRRREDLIGTPWAQGTSPERLEAYRAQWEKLMRGERVAMRTTLSRPSGPPVVVDVSSAMILRGERKFVFAILRDVTDQVNSEQELRRSREDLERHVAERTAQLRESEERFRRITEATPSPMTITRPDGEILYVNEAAGRLFRVGPEEAVGRNAVEFYPDSADRAAMRDLILQKGTVESYELRLRRADGAVFWTVVNLRMMTFQGGPAILGTFLDIDARKRAEEALRKATEELERRVVDRTAELARANALLYEEIVERKRAENVLRLILEGTAAVTGGSFFRSLARHLGSALNVRYAVVVQGVHQPAGQARTIAFWDGKDFLSPLDYALAGTPCEDVMSGEACSYGHDVQRLFPDDKMLVDLEIQSYLGVPMVDSAGSVVGLLAVMDEKPVSDEELKLSVLKIFAARAGIELERQLAEEALRESEERWRSLVTNAPDVILTVDREGRILSINRTVTGARVADVLGRRVHEWVPPDVVPKVNAALENAFKAGKSSSYETLSQGPNGTSAWYITRVGPVKVGDQVVCATFIATDITERWKGEQRQKVQHEVTRVLAESPSLHDAAPRILRTICEELDWQVGILWWADPVANVLRLAEAWHQPRPAFEEFVSSSRPLTFPPGAGVVGMAWSRKAAMWTPDLLQDPQFLRPDIPGAAGLRTQFLLPVEGPRGMFGLLEFFSTEKRERDEPLLQLASTVGSQIGQFIERKRAEEDLRFQKSLLESQSEAAIDGILVVSRDGVMTSFNRRFCQMWDIPEDVIQSRTDERALQAVLDKLQDPKEFLNRVRHLYDHPDEESRDEIRLKDGRAFDRYSAPVKGADGKLYGRVWYFRDITGRKQTEENLRRAAEETRQMYEDLKEAQAQLIRSEKLASIGMLVSGVAHEINNPLNVMYGNLQLLAEVSDVLLPLAVEGARSKKVRGTASRVGKFRGMIRDALKAARHAREIVQDFRNFARDTRTAELVDLNQCLEEAVTLMQRELPPGIRVVRKLRRVPQIRCLRGQISQVFLNLLKNAGEAIEKKGTITLRTSQKDGHAVVEVADSGRGMPEEVRQKLFEPFFTTKPVGKGLGLGLSISAMIVHNHSGRITVRSRPGRGSVFRVELPLPV
jgi:PAS domain S-box-containing protein